MDYIPTWKSSVFAGFDKERGPRWIDLSRHHFLKCLDPNTSVDEVAGMFPGPCFYGRLVGQSDAEDIAPALEVLRAVRGMHAELTGGDTLLKAPDRDAVQMAEYVERVAKSCRFLDLKRGDGYTSKLNPEMAVPQCHIYHCELNLPLLYSKWLEPRAKALDILESVFMGYDIFYLKTTHNAYIVDNGDGNGFKLVVDVYGHQSLLSDWDGFLERYEEMVSEETVLTGLELVAGLLHLSDFLASIHLTTAMAVVECGGYKRPMADDALTDLWFMSYDSSADVNYTIGSCEVCHRLFIGTSKSKRGHRACMNKQRARKSRAKKYFKLLEEGMNEADAARKAGISPATAREVIEEDRPTD